MNKTGLLKKFFAFFFYNGAAGGLLWAGGILAATYAATKSILLFYAKTTTTSIDEKNWFVTTTAYAFAYALTALFIHRQWLARRPPKLAGLLAILLAASLAVVPSIILFFLNKLSWNSVESLQLGNVFNQFSLHDEDQRIYHLYFACGWLALAIALNAKWFFRQVSNFHQPPIAPPVLP